jgi:hypothetical protein
MFVFVYVILCVGRYLATARSPVQGGVPAVCRSNKVKRRPSQNKMVIELLLLLLLLLLLFKKCRILYRPDCTESYL